MRIRMLEVIRFLHQRRIRCGIKTVADNVPSEEQCTAEIRNLATDILASIPWILGDISDRNESTCQGMAIGSLMLLWPIRACIMAECLTPEEHQWVMCKIAYISDEVGIASANTLPKHCEDFKKSESQWFKEHVLAIQPKSPAD